MSKILALPVLLALLVAGYANAQTLVRNTSAMEQVPIQGVSLSMSPKQAFDALRSAGFKAGDLDTFEDWTTDGIEFVRGTYGSPEGYSSLSMTRRNGRLVNISETYNAPGSPLDANAEIGPRQSQLNIPADSRRCRVASASSGTCEVQDADAGEDVSVRYTLQILSTMRIATITRTKELN